MERTLGMERTYVLGQYKNIKLSDQITGIPEELFLNPEFVAQLRNLQIQQLEHTYLNYVKDAVTVREDVLNAHPDTIEEVISRVEDNRVTAFEKLIEAKASVYDNVKPAKAEKETKETK